MESAIAKRCPTPPPQMATLMETINNEAGALVERLRALKDRLHEPESPDPTETPPDNTDLTSQANRALSTLREAATVLETIELSV